VSHRVTTNSKSHINISLTNTNGRVGVSLFTSAGAEARAEDTADVVVTDNGIEVVVGGSADVTVDAAESA
jgi:hypothetical protein